jgi:hypothetical protein
MPDRRGAQRLILRTAPWPSTAVQKLCSWTAFHRTCSLRRRGLFHHDCRTGEPTPERVAEMAAGIEDGAAALRQGKLLLIPPHRSLERPGRGRRRRARALKTVYGVPLHCGAPRAGRVDELLASAAMKGFARARRGGRQFYAPQGGEAAPGGHSGHHEPTLRALRAAVAGCSSAVPPIRAGILQMR